VTGVPVPRLDLTADEFLDATGWELKPEGACRDDVCVPLPELSVDADGRFDARVVADRLGLPIAHDASHELWAFGPESGNRRVLDSARMPPLALPDFNGTTYDLASSRGRKLLVVAWASW
jgi:hypothetical protein